MNDAVALKDQYRKPTLQPELILLALLRHPDTSGSTFLLDVFKSTRAVDLEKLDRQVHLAIEGRGDPNGNLDFLAKGDPSSAVVQTVDYPD